MPSPLGAVALDPEGAPVGGCEPSGGVFGDVAEVFDPEVFGLGLASGAVVGLAFCEFASFVDPG
jgi:hypothetical protein